MRPVDRAEVEGVGVEVGLGSVTSARCYARRARSGPGAAWWPESDVDARASCPVPYRSDSHEALLERRETVRSELATLDARIRALSRVARTERVRRGVSSRSVLAGLVSVLLVSAFCVATLPRLAQARVEVTKIDVVGVRSVVEMYRAHNPRAACPTISTLVSERILTSSTRTHDAWNHEYRIVCVGEDVTVTSAGPDRSWGTEDDIR